MNKKYGTWTRLMALCLTLLLAVGVFGTAALAARIEKDTGSIKVSGVEDGVTVNAYQVMTVNFDYDSNPQQPVDPVYSWSSAVSDWVRNNYESYIKTDDSVTEAFTTADTDDIAAFYDALAAAIKGKTVTLASSGFCTGNGTISSLPMGGYLILVENGMKVYRPSAVNIEPEYSGNENTGEWTMSTSTLAVKASDMTMDKTVNEDETGDGHDKDVSDQAGIGETVNFDLRTNVPQYPANAFAKQYAISDTLSAGLTLEEDSITVYGVTEEGETKKLAKDTAYTQEITRPDPNKRTTRFTLTFDYDQIKDYDKIHVDYNAVVNSNAVVGGAGNPNEAVLNYNNNPYDSNSWKEQPDEVKVYTYGLKVNKVNNADELLTGAEFTLSKDGINLLSFVNIGDGTYRVATDEDAQGTTTTTLQVGANGDTKGKLNISGLSVGTYYLTETKVPGGYNKPSNPVTIIEIKDEDCDGRPTINNDDNNEFGDGFVELNVVNTKGFKLPTTGGMGTFLFTMGGVAIMGAAILLFFVLRRRKAVSDK